LKNDIPNYDNYLELMESLNVIKNNNNFTTLLTSWTPPLSNKADIETLIREGEEYMKQIDSAVKDCYKDKNTSTLDYCRDAAAKLGLPPFLVNPIVDRAFKSHLD
jgi:hydroxyacylglutathione hydrolase